MTRGNHDDQQTGAAVTYSAEEITQLKDALGDVLLGATMSGNPGAVSTVREWAAAIRATTNFLAKSSSPLLQQIGSASASTDWDDTNTASQAAEQAMNAGVAAAKRSYDSVLAKSGSDDADAWAHLLLTASNAAVEATRTGGFLGIGGERITSSEHAYIQRLAKTLGYTIETSA